VVDAVEAVKNVVDKEAIAVRVVALAYGNADEVVDDAAIVVGLVVLIVGNVVGDGVVEGVWDVTVVGH
jgi:hypothetical protein